MNSPSFSLARALPAAAILCLLASSGEVDANERHFVYTYESAVLNPGHAELEPWTTFRFGRDAYYSRFDQRLEFEVGLFPRLQTSLYINFTGLAQDIAVGDELERVSEFEFEGVSSEWKLKLTDPVANAIGSALYLEVTGSPLELELEGKLILDKRIGSLLLASNLVFEREWEFEEADETEAESVFEVDLAAGYFVRPRLMLGLELRNHNEFIDEGWEHSALFAGPALSFVHKGGWVSLSVLRQLPALRAGEDGGPLVLDEHEKLNARLIFGFDL